MSYQDKVIFCKRIIDTMELQIQYTNCLIAEIIKNVNADSLIYSQLFINSNIS